jgi:hypothetical protein
MQSTETGSPVSSHADEQIVCLDEMREYRHDGAEDGDGAGSGSCPVAGSGISGVEPSGSATRELVREMDLREIGSEDGIWMELAQDHVQ